MPAKESVTVQLSESELLRVDEHLRRKALERCGHVHDAEDLVQDTHLAAQRNANGTDHRENTWQAINLMGGLYKSRNRNQRTSLYLAAPTMLDQTDSGGGDPASIAEYRELCAVLARELEKLPDEVRIPLCMYWYEGKTYSEIAIACELGDESAARRRCSEGIKALERRFGQRSGGRRLLALPAWALLAGSAGGTSGWSWKLLLRKPVVWVTALLVGVVVALYFASQVSEVASGPSEGPLVRTVAINSELGNAELVADDSDELETKRTFHASGALQAEWTQFKDGRKHGHYVVYHENGEMKRTQEFEHGLSHGWGVYFTKDGIERNRVLFSKGKVSHARRSLPAESPIR